MLCELNRIAIHIGVEAILMSTNNMFLWRTIENYHLGRVKRIWYLSPMRAAKVQASLRIRAVSPEPLLLAHTSNESRGIFRQKARSLASLNGWACAVKICHEGMLEDTNSLDGAQTIITKYPPYLFHWNKSQIQSTEMQKRKKLASW